MNTLPRFLKTAVLAATLPWALPAADSGLTLYNGGFAVVRETIPVTLSGGAETVTITEITRQLDPASVVLRDPTGQATFRILEQNYRADPVSVGSLLEYFSGQTIPFLHYVDDEPVRTEGKIIRSGYTPGGGNESPIIEVDGELRFSLPGQPLFPALGDDAILKPTLTWLVDSPESAAFDARLSYLTDGFSWQADYNLVLPESGDVATLNGWVTLQNRSGRTFTDARIKLLAGDVNRVRDPQPELRRARAAMMAEDARRPEVEQKALDSFHLYTLPRKTTLRDRQTQQVEFLRGDAVKTEQRYVYDGTGNLLSRVRGWNPRDLRTNPDIGGDSQPKVAVFRDVANTETNGLGVPLPAGKVRVYRQDTDGALEFIGEDRIDHTPREETVELFLGNAFDLVGERTRTRIDVDSHRDWMRESFAITLKNRSEQAATVTVVEPLFRWTNWTIEASSQAFEKTDAQTIEFTVDLPAGTEETVTYTVYYTW
ncbi:MAG: DUF4139 domain-containing protein [Opitutales bacterium]